MLGIMLSLYPSSPIPLKLPPQKETSTRRPQRISALCIIVSWALNLERGLWDCDRKGVALANCQRWFSSGLLCNFLSAWHELDKRFYSPPSLFLSYSALISFPLSCCWHTHIVHTIVWWDLCFYDELCGAFFIVLIIVFEAIHQGLKRDLL